mmetsp:Transcript_27805/g.50246  ORF Transcript_27805/g.50246 Transcript_27805/m.50246 type:complete len:281 (+) Transcript_27805:2389-3231(+)
MLPTVLVELSLPSGKMKFGLPRATLVGLAESPETGRAKMMQKTWFGFRAVLLQKSKQTSKLHTEEQSPRVRIKKILSSPGELRKPQKEKERTVTGSKPGRKIGIDVQRMVGGRTGNGMNHGTGREAPPSGSRVSVTSGLRTIGNGRKTGIPKVADDRKRKTKTEERIGTTIVAREAKVRKVMRRGKRKRKAPRKVKKVSRVRKGRLRSPRKVETGKGGRRLKNARKTAKRSRAKATAKAPGKSTRTLILTAREATGGKSRKREEIEIEMAESATSLKMAL